jgi:phosphatidylinositol alpha-mannosyltransferase
MSLRDSTARVVLTAATCWPEVRRGGERYLHELAAALRRAGHDVRIVSTAPTASSDQVLEVPVQRLRRRELARYGELGGQVAFGMQALAAVGWRRFDVWHATSTADAAAAAHLCRTRQARSVFTDHGFPAERSRGQRSDARLHRQVVRYVDDYVCVSAAAGAYLRSDYGRDAVVVPPGVVVDAYRPAPRRREPTILYAGSLSEPRKGLPLLADAVRILRRSVPSLRLELYGQGTPPAQVAAAADVCRLSAPGELAQRYAEAWVTVLPSTAEAFGMVLTESLAAGTPVVALTEGGGPAEIITPEVGRLADATPDSLADACCDGLMLATAPSTADACRARAELFDWDRAVVPRLEEVYAGV